MSTRESDRRTIERLRRGLLVIAAVVLVGTAIELTMRSHWTQVLQLVAWASLVLLATAIVLVLGTPSPARLRAARVICVLVSIAAIFGIVQHVIGNYDAGPLDAAYGDRWDSMSESARWWAALIQAVGPSPALAPGVLIVAAMCVWTATINHPATASSGESLEH